ncbi:MAG: MarC family protein [Deferribacteraceae bacterium]|jgi:multiple antibiotic resistance protein|nr:MarC family protein [Deferribacteraceae bacterium]
MDFFNNIMLSAFSLLAITNPFGMLPVFISMTDDLAGAQRKKLFRLTVYVAALIMVIFTFVGTFVMEHFFQVELSQLRVAGGILLVAMGMKNIIFPSEHKNHDIKDYNVSDSEANQRLVPMAFPLLVGPGALTTIIIINKETGLAITMLAILVTFGIIFVLFLFAHLIERLLGKLAMSVVSRIMQVFIMTIGVKMFVTGIKDIFLL